MQYQRSLADWLNLSSHYISIDVASGTLISSFASVTAFTCDVSPPKAHAAIYFLQGKSTWLTFFEAYISLIEFSACWMLMVKWNCARNTVMNQKINWFPVFHRQLRKIFVQMTACQIVKRQFLLHLSLQNDKELNSILQFLPQKTAID